MGFACHAICYAAQELEEKEVPGYRICRLESWHSFNKILESNKELSSYFQFK